MTEEISPKSYGTAVTLCGIFGVVGIHHFYLEDWAHGIVDLLLFVLTLYFFLTDQEGWALIFLAVDSLHTIVIFYYLIIERWRDGRGRLIKLSKS